MFTVLQAKIKSIFQLTKENEARVIQSIGSNFFSAI